MRRSVIALVIAAGLLAAACTQPSGGAGGSQAAPAAPASAAPVKPGY
jgi:hypothetical protein